MRKLRGRFVLCVGVLLVVIRLAHTAVLQSYYGPGVLPASRAVVILPGGTAAVADRLHDDGVIQYRLIFRAAAWFTRGAGLLHAGEFLIPAHASIAAILETLRSSQPVQHQVTIPEGLTGTQIAGIINQAPAATGKIAPPADGATLPQTYNYTLGTPRAAILARAAAAMQTTLNTAWARRDRSICLVSPQDALTLAAIVQQETPINAEMPQIAAVYENRLAIGMKLQADPTVIYAASYGKTAAGQPITRADLALNSPYNTYVYPGLPPGPISSPGLTAITAVLHPAHTPAIYFVAAATGGHVFATSFQQQLANIARWDAEKASKQGQGALPPGPPLRGPAPKNPYKVGITGTGLSEANAAPLFPNLHKWDPKGESP